VEFLHNPIPWKDEQHQLRQAVKTYRSCLLKAEIYFVDKATSSVCKNKKMMKKFEDKNKRRCHGQKLRQKNTELQ